MKALVYHGAHRVAVLEREIPVPGQGEVRIRVGAAGVCGTDRHIVAGEFPATPGIVLGHENAGWVDALGEGVTDLETGQLVAIDPNMPCGQCRMCLEGRSHFCERMQSVGVTRDGGFATYTVVPRSQVYPVPRSLDVHVAALAEPVSCCVHGIDLAAPRPGETVAIFGLGPIGLILAQLLRRSGAARIVGIEPNPERRRFAQSWMDEVWPPEQTADANTFSMVVDASGHPSALEQAVSLVEPTGTILQFGVAAPSAVARIHPYEVYRKEIRIVGAYINPHTFGRAIRLLASEAVDPKVVPTEDVSVEELPDLLLGKRPPRALKTFMVS